MGGMRRGAWEEGRGRGGFNKVRGIREEMEEME